MRTGNNKQIVLCGNVNQINVESFFAIYNQKNKNGNIDIFHQQQYCLHLSPNLHFL